MYKQLNGWQKEQVLIAQEELRSKRRAYSIAVLDRWQSGTRIEDMAEWFCSTPGKVKVQIKAALAELFLDSKDREFDLMILMEFTDNLRSLQSLRKKLRYTYKRKFQVLSNSGGIKDLEEDDSDKAEIIKVNDSINRTLTAIAVMKSKIKGSIDGPDTRKDAIAQITSALGLMLMNST